MNYGGYLTVALIAVGLAMDCFAVSISRGMASGKRRLANALLLAASFGSFQAAMPLLGYYAGEKMIGYISGFDHWIAFFLLAAIGVKMILESREKEDKCGIKMTLPLLLTLSVATSIDAFAVGLSFAFLSVDILTAAVVIGLVSFILSFAGFLVGCRAGWSLGGRAELFGGLLLLGIGAKILAEHIF
jgi:putative Mn2+ efflux pump MntP